MVIKQWMHEYHNCRRHDLIEPIKNEDFTQRHGIFYRFHQSGKCTGINKKFAAVRRSPVPLFLTSLVPLFFLRRLCFFVVIGILPVNFRIKRHLCASMSTVQPPTKSVSGSWSTGVRRHVSCKFPYGKTVASVSVASVPWLFLH